MVAGAQMHCACCQFVTTTFMSILANVSRAPFLQQGAVQTVSSMQILLKLVCAAWAVTVHLASFVGFARNRHRCRAHHLFAIQQICCFLLSRQATGLTTLCFHAATHCRQVALRSQRVLLAPVLALVEVRSVVLKVRLNVTKEKVAANVATCIFTKMMPASNARIQPRQPLCL
jgi:hypothetical protein